MGTYSKLRQLSKSQSPAIRKSSPKMASPKKRTIARQQASNTAINIASNNAILQLSTEDIEQLKEIGYKARTYRLTDREAKWVKDTAHLLDDDIKRGEISRVDLVRVGIKLVERLLSVDKKALIRILEAIK